MLNLATYKSKWRTVVVAGLCMPSFVFLTVGHAYAQASAPATSVQLTPPLEILQSNTTAGVPEPITFADALLRARANNPQMQAAFTALGLAHEDVVESRAALLPSVNYNMQAIYTEPTSRGSNNPIFIANNGVHEYIAQGNVHQNLSLQTFADYGRAAAAQAVARAKSEIALRGLTVTVAQAYYGYLAAQHRYKTAQRANEQAQRFLGISEKLEKGGEVAHSDAIKALLQAQQQRDLREAELVRNKSRLDLAVLLFRDFNENFTVADDLTSLDPPSRRLTRLRWQALEIILISVRRKPLCGKPLGGTSAWGGVLPSVSLDYWYGIDANRFATKVDGINTLGSAAGHGERTTAR